MFYFLLSCAKSVAELTVKLPWILIFISVKYTFEVNLDIVIPYVQHFQITNIIEKAY